MDPSGLVFLYMNTEILTNGVSFSLVDGACCVVRFSNPAMHTDSRVINYTLNINSTGDKNMYSIAGKIDGFYISLPKQGPYLFLYSSSVYVVQTTTDSYNDAN